MQSYLLYSSATSHEAQEATILGDYESLKSLGPRAHQALLRLSLSLVDPDPSVVRGCSDDLIS